MNNKGLSNDLTIVLYTILLQFVIKGNPSHTRISSNHAIARNRKSTIVNFTSLFLFIINIENTIR